MRQLFISYARENKADVEALVRDLDALGYQAWFDFALRGGQSWWEEILRRIADSDVFVAVVSEQTLNSVACKRELEWALALNKPILPLAVQRLPEALPRALSMRQIIDYSASARDAAIALAVALTNLPAAPPPPQPLPTPPAIPLSYISGLVDLVAQSDTLTHDQQREILIDLESALRSTDAEERRAGRYVLEMFNKRSDLYADIDHNLAHMQGSEPGTSAPKAAESLPKPKGHRVPGSEAARSHSARSRSPRSQWPPLRPSRSLRGGGAGSGTGSTTNPLTPSATDSTATGAADTAPPPRTAVTRTPDARSFTSPSRNIGCMIDASGVRCDIQQRYWDPPRRPRDCPPATGYGQGITLSPAAGRSSSAPATLPSVAGNRWHTDSRSLPATWNARAASRA